MFDMTACQFLQMLKKLKESLSIDFICITNKVPGADTVSM